MALIGDYIKNYCCNYLFMPYPRSIYRSNFSKLLIEVHPKCFESVNPIIISNTYVF